MYRPGQPVLILLGIQHGRLIPVRQETALHNDNRRLHMEQEEIVVVGLGYSRILVAQDEVKPLLQRLRQLLPFSDPL